MKKCFRSRQIGIHMSSLFFRREKRETKCCPASIRHQMLCILVHTIFFIHLQLNVFSIKPWSDSLAKTVTTERWREIGRKKLTFQTGTLSILSFAASEFDYHRLQFPNQKRQLGETYSDQKSFSGSFLPSIHFFPVI